MVAGCLEMEDDADQERVLADACYYQRVQEDEISLVDENSALLQDLVGKEDVQHPKAQDDLENQVCVEDVVAVVVARVMDEDALDHYSSSMLDEVALDDHSSSRDYYLHHQGQLYYSEIFLYVDYHKLVANMN